MGFSQFDPARALEHWGRYRPKAAAVVNGSETISYAALSAEAGRIAESLGAAAPGDRVAVLSDSKTELLRLVLGTARSGRPVVVLNPKLPREALLTNLADSGARFLLHSGHAFAADLERQLRDVGESRAPAETTSDTPIWGVLFSSGSTGVPKGIERDRTSIAVEAVGWCLELALTRHTEFYVGRPMFYTGGLLLALSVFLVGGTVVFGEYDDTDPKEAWFDYQQQARTRELDWAFFVPDQLRSFIDLAAGTPADQLAAARTVLTMGAPITASEKLAVRAALRSQVVESWGNSESLGTITEADDLDLRPKSIGRPFLTDRLLVVDDDGKPRPPQEVGRLAGGKEAGFRAYAGRPEQTATAFKDDLIVSEDLGYEDDDGYFYVLGRVQDAVIVGDRTIFIPTIEAELRQIGGVADCGVVALPTGPGEIRLSCLAVVQGTDTAGTHAAVVARLRAETPTIEVVCGDSVPKTPSGKIDRLALKARLQDV